MLEDVGFVGVQVGPAADTFGGAGGEGNARAYEVYGYAFLARKPVPEPTARRPGCEVIEQQRR